VQVKRRSTKTPATILKIVVDCLMFFRHPVTFADQAALIERMMHDPKGQDALLEGSAGFAGDDSVAQQQGPIQRFPIVS
jgi:hypothetical protein